MTFSGQGQHTRGPSARKIKKRVQNNKMTLLNTTVKAEKALALAKTLAKRPELKFVDSTITLTPFSNNSALGLLSLTVLGALNSNRLGQEVTPQKMLVRLRATLPATTPYGSYRIVIYRWDISAPSPSDILVSQNPEQQYKPDQIDNYKILYDKTFNLNAASTLQRWHLINVKLNREPKMIYNNLNVPTSNAVYIQVFSDGPVLANAVSLEGTSRFWFYDM